MQLTNQLSGKQLKLIMYTAILRFNLIFMQIPYIQIFMNKDDNIHKQLFNLV